MIVNVRGTSGSGKTTVIRRFLKLAKTKARVKERGTAKIIGYIIDINVDKPVFVMGPYEDKACGGCDCFPNISKVFSEVHYWHDHGFHVIFEGLLISRSKGRVIDLWDDIGRQNLFLLHLTTPLEDCFEGIRQRRLKRGNSKPVNRTQTEETYHRANKISVDLLDLGIPGLLVDRDQAFFHLKRVLDESRSIAAARHTIL